MAVADKSVSTEDFLLQSNKNTCLEVAKLEAILNTLVESKVEAIKNEKKTSSLHSSPKAITNRFRITSTSTSSSKEKEIYPEQISNVRKQHRERKENGKDHNYKTTPDKHKKKLSYLSSEDMKHTLGNYYEKSSILSDEDTRDSLSFLKYKRVCNADLCIPNHQHVHSCYYSTNSNGQIKMSFDEDYISLKIEDYEIMEDDLNDQEVLKRLKRKRRKRKKRRIKRQIAITAMPIEETIKVIDPDELPQRARWTIVATACLLLFMCLLLVGVTLRMAPIIDDMVRKENEELMHSLHREQIHHSNNHSSTPVPFK